MIISIISGFANIIFNLHTHHFGVNIHDNLLFIWITTVFVNIGLYVFSVLTCAYFSVP
jgi:hypothetical protein